MTREEAIVILDCERPYGNCGCGASDEEIEEALNMAIKALEQELCESSIQPKLSVDRVCDILVEMFETPCDYRFNDIDIDDFMCDDDYCEHHCSYVGKGECWKRFFEKYDKFSKESD